MGAFEYTALEPGAAERKGILEGDTPRHIRQLLRERQAAAGDGVRDRRERVEATKRLRQEKERSPRPTWRSSQDSLRRWCAPALPLEEALLAVSQQTEKPRVARASSSAPVLASWRAITLAGGFAEFPRVFPEIYRATISAGEQSGYLGYHSRATRRLHGRTREPFAAESSRAMLYRSCSRHVLRHRVGAAGVRSYPRLVAVF